MAFKEILPRLRKERGVTQQELASKLYVTRQAVSRWETGETEPGVDMRKLIAVALDVPVVELLDLPDEQLCQCCGTPFSIPNMPHGTNADGSENGEFCKWCLINGNFAYNNLEDLIETTAPFLMEAMHLSRDEAVSFMGALAPTLKHWQD
ncbi:helix-turn-helix domain-containing protein [Eggerthellaceae bacterium zg-887]|uniref:zinc ribbon domain-containing protein n=1 Tax=Xiamenia xianingshaonis TaxID=2682776 RepID=UPI00140C7E82|nr:zinc ribbon domain-containing protein [Xiamenia xianingshaonis]NHM15309.1 helix-turn-helix domain-containing protein [Xiamenia xianingshaonis]